MFILAYIHSTCNISIILPLNIYWEQNALCSHWVELMLLFISLDSSKTIFALVPNCHLCLFLSGCICGTMLSKESSPTEQDLLESLCALPDILLSWLPTQALPLSCSFPEVYGVHRKEGGSASSVFSWNFLLNSFIYEKQTNNRSSEKFSYVPSSQS